MNSLDPIKIPSRIALVHEWFSSGSVGGSEQVVNALDKLLCSMHSQPDLVALVDNESKNSKSWLFGRSIKTSFIQNLPLGAKHVQSYLPFLPLAIEQIDLGDYPLVISSSHLVAKGILTSPDQLHLSYVHTPVRYAWDQMNTYLKRSLLSRIGFEPFIRWQLHKLRQWDQLSATRVDHLIANSNFTARRIWKYWGRKSEVIHPPVDVDRFNFNRERNDYYLCLCRLVPNKKVDIVVKAFNELNLPLIVVGEGPEKRLLQELAGPTVDILGYQDKEEVVRLMEHCRAYVYAGVEDFGIAPVEAMAAGAPVIALGKGGLLDTVRCASIDLKTANGLLFNEQNVESLVQAVLWFEEKKLWTQMSSESINNFSQNFRPQAFSKRFERTLISAWKLHVQAREKVSNCYET